MSRLSARQAVAVAVLVLLALLAFWLGFQSLVIEFVRARLLRPFWVIYLVFRAIPPWLLWTALLTIILLLARRSLSVRERLAPPPPFEEPPALGPVAAEMHWLNLAAHSRYGRWRLAQRLSQLALNTLAQREHLSTHAVRQALQSDELDAPSPVRAYLRSGFGSPLPEHVRALDHLLRLFRPPTPSATPDRRPLETVEYLESLLEVKRDAQS